MFQKENIPSGQNAHHCLGQNAHARGRFTPQFCQVESCHQLAIIVTMDTSNLIYMSDMKMLLIFFRILIDSLACIHDIIPGICWQCFEIRTALTYRWIRRPRNTQQTAVYTLGLTHLLIMITIDVCSVHNEFDSQKGFRIKTAGYFC